MQTISCLTGAVSGYCLCKYFPERWLAISAVRSFQRRIEVALRDPSYLVLCLNSPQQILSTNIEEAAIELSSYSQLKCPSYSCSIRCLRLKQLHLQRTSMHLWLISNRTESSSTFRVVRSLEVVVENPHAGSSISKARWELSELEPRDSMTWCWSSKVSRKKDQWHLKSDSPPLSAESVKVASSTASFGQRSITAPVTELLHKMHIGKFIGILRG